MSPTARGALLVAVALLIPILPFAVIGELPGEEWLDATGGDALLFGLAGAGLLGADILLPVPSSIVGTLLGARLGFLPGMAWAWIGLMAGALVGYITGRFVLGRIGGRLPKAPTTALLLLSRPVPVLAEAVALTAGAEAMPLLRFTIATGSGNLLYAAALAGSGAALLPQGLAGPGLAVPLAIPAAGWLLWRWRRRRTEHGQSESETAA